jgi:hypothetical protein
LIRPSFAARPTPALFSARHGVKLKPLLYLELADPFIFLEETTHNKLRDIT